MIRGEFPIGPDNRLHTRSEPSLFALILAVQSEIEQQHPTVQTIYLTEHVYSVRVLLPDGRTETITELR